MFKAVFSDVDGTLLNSCHLITPRTRNAILSLQAAGIPFVISSARGPSGIYPLEAKAGINCPIIAYSGARIQDADGNVLYNSGLSIDRASEVTRFIEDNRLDPAWCAYIGDEWITADRSDPRIINEERIVESQSRCARVESLPAGTLVNKILCICNPGKIASVEAILKARFPDLAIYRSGDILIEIMTAGTNKASAVKEYCRIYGIDTDRVIAFGDNYNDVEMLTAVGRGVIMGNAPAELLQRFPNRTEDNDHDGIAVELSRYWDV